MCLDIKICGNIHVTYESIYVNICAMYEAIYMKYTKHYTCFIYGKLLHSKHKSIHLLYGILYILYMM
jgi:hypothetical protein